MKRPALRLAALLLSALLLPGVAAASAPVLVDMTGREIALDQPVERIVALMPGDCEILFAIGAGPALVGRGEYCDYPEAVRAVPAVQTGSGINVEQLIALRPQVVVMTKMGQTREQIETLQNAGITTAVTDAQDIRGVYESIAFLGALTGRAEEAAALSRSMQESFLSITERVGDREGVSAYYEVSPLQWGLWAAGEGTFMDEIGNLMKLENIFSDVAGWAEVSEEAVISRDPGVIVTTTMYFGEGPLPEDEVRGRRGWDLIAAVRGGRVFRADGDAITRPGPRLAEAAEAMYRFVYGDGEAE